MRSRLDTTVYEEDLRALRGLHRLDCQCRTCIYMPTYDVWGYPLGDLDGSETSNAQIRVPILVQVSA